MRPKIVVLILTLALGIPTISVLAGETHGGRALAGETHGGRMLPGETHGGE